MRYRNALSASLAFNGQIVTDWDKFSEGEIERRSRVDLPKKTGFVRRKAKYGFSLDYVIPADGPIIDFINEVEDGTVTIIWDDGTSTVYSGVSALKAGEVEYNEEKESVQKIDFMAVDKQGV